eukprot:gene5968-5837_t
MNLQILITIASAYVSFIIAQDEQFLGISGVLCASAAGLMLAWRAPPFILQHHQMHQVWGVLEWTCNTCIFFVAGLSSGNKMVRSKITGVDIALIFVAYIILTIIRIIVVGVLFPIVSKGGLVCTPKDAIFMIWGGLRGALGICLALIVTSGRSIMSTQLTDKFFIYIAGIAALTLIINASTAKSFLKYLKLVDTDAESEGKKMILDRIRRRMRAKMIEESKDLGATETFLDKLLNPSNYLARSSSRTSKESDRPSRIEARNDILIYVRTSFFNALRILYHEAIENGKIGRATYAAHTLLNSIDVAMDSIGTQEQKLFDWDWIETTFEISPFFHWIGDKLDYLFSLCGIVYILTNFIDAHEEMQHKIYEIVGGKDENGIPIPEVEQQTQMVQSMEDEGLLSPKDSTSFLSIIEKDKQ